MTEKFTKLNVEKELINLLNNQDAISQYLKEAFSTKNPAYISKSLGIVARAKGITEIAKETGLSRTKLYDSLSENGNPTLKTLLSLANAMHIDITVKPQDVSEPTH